MAIQSSRTSTSNWRQWVYDQIQGFSGGGGTPAGSNQEIQFNDNGSFGASSNLTWNGATLRSLNVIAGNPGNEGTGILINGSQVDSSLKCSSIGASDQAQFIMHRHSTTITPSLIAARSNSDTNAHANVVNDLELFSIRAVGWHTATYEEAARINFVVDGTPGANDMPGRIEFATTPDASDTPVVNLTLDQAGDLIFNDLAVMKHPTNAGSWYLSGGNAANLGFNIRMGGQTGTFAYDMEMRQDSTRTLKWDNTSGSWDFWTGFPTPTTSFNMSAAGLMLSQKSSGICGFGIQEGTGAYYMDNGNNTYMWSGGTADEWALVVGNQTILTLGASGAPADNEVLAHIAANGRAEWKTLAEIGGGGGPIAAITNYNRSGYMQFHNGGNTGAPVSYDIDANVTEVTWETIGPTGSGADNIYADLDVLPTETRSIFVRIEGSGVCASTTSTILVWAADGDQSGTQNNNYQVYEHQVGDDSATVFTSHQHVWIPCNADQVFYIRWDQVNVTSPSVTLTLLGFATD